MLFYNHTLVFSFCKGRDPDSHRTQRMNSDAHIRHSIESSRVIFLSQVSGFEFDIISNESRCKIINIGYGSFHIKNKQWISPENIEKLCFRSVCTKNKQILSTFHNLKLNVRIRIRNSGSQFQRSGTVNKN